jgi:hypothetical protein
MSEIEEPTNISVKFLAKDGVFTVKSNKEIPVSKELLNLVSITFVGGFASGLAASILSFEMASVIYGIIKICWNKNEIATSIGLGIGVIISSKLLYNHFTPLKI